MYADSVYYKDTYKGTSIPDAELDSHLQRASDLIDQLTYFRIVDGLTSLTAFQQTQIKNAVCSQADRSYELNGMVEGIGSYNVGDVSVSLKDGFEPVSRTAMGYLRSTGLMYRGL